MKTKADLLHDIEILKLQLEVAKLEKQIAELRGANAYSATLIYEYPNATPTIPYYRPTWTFSTGSVIGPESGWTPNQGIT